MTAVEATRVAAGVGLPLFWVNGMCQVVATEVADWKDDHLDLTDYATRASCLRQLALWAGDDGKGQAYWLAANGDTGWRLMTDDGRGSAGAAWSEFGPGAHNVAWFEFGPGAQAVPGMPWFAITGRPEGPTEALVAILTHIGMDHDVRRWLKWPVEPGTLMEMLPGTRQGRDLPIQRAWGFVLGGKKRWFTGAADWAEDCGYTYVEALASGTGNGILESVAAKASEGPGV